ncbi:MAG TPA: hypothetical protein VFD90_21255 [Gaiellales bacterium]|jgi:hypothetical protein|nr:hypothetical protein [Gaiellales bacterium]
MSSPVGQTAPGVRPRGADGALASRTFGAVAILSGAAAGIHLGVAPEHFAEWWGYGTFFVLAAVGECALVALLALRPRAWVVQAGIWASLATMLMYLISRTSGIPLGPASGVVEPIELPGLAATAAEGALVVVLCGLLGGRERRHTLNALGLVGGALWIAALAGALAPPAQPVASGHGGHEAPVAHASMGVPFIPDSVRNAPRVAGDG